jgi:hypothetical protein
MSFAQKNQQMKEARERSARLREVHEQYRRETLHLVAVELEKAFDAFEKSEAQ